MYPFQSLKKRTDIFVSSMPTITALSDNVNNCCIMTKKTTTVHSRGSLGVCIYIERVYSVVSNGLRASSWQSLYQISFNSNKAKINFHFVNSFSCASIVCAGPVLYQALVTISYYTS